MRLFILDNQSLACRLTGGVTPCPPSAGAGAAAKRTLLTDVAAFGTESGPLESSLESDPLDSSLARLSPRSPPAAAPAPKSPASAGAEGDRGELDLGLSAPLRRFMQQQSSAIQALSAALAEAQRTIVAQQEAIEALVRKQRS